MRKDNRDKLVAAIYNYKKWRYPTNPYPSLPNWVSQAGTTNGLTKLVIYWFRLHGWHAERISSGGRFIKGRERYTDVLGMQREIGSDKWIKGSSQAGTADTEAFPRGEAWKIEIKNAKTKDRSAKHQVTYGDLVSMSSGNYIVIKSADEFLDWYEKMQFGTSPFLLDFWIKAKEMGEKTKHTYKIA